MRESGYVTIARIRFRELTTRIGLAMFIGVTAWVMAPSGWPLVWFAAVGLTQGIDWLVFRPLRLHPERDPSEGLKIACAASAALNTAVYSAIALYLWTSGGPAGALFALVQVAGGLLHVSLHMHHVRRVLIAGVVPHGIYFLGLPLWGALSGGGVQAMFVMVACLLYLAHLVVAVRQTSTVTHHLTVAKAEADDQRERAERANAAKSDFLAVITHEIRTPMNAVISAANLLRRTRLDSRQREHVDMLLDAGDVLIGLLNDVLDVSKIEAGKLELESADVDVRAKLESMARLWSPKAQALGVRLRLTMADDLPAQLTMDPLRFQQIVFNLISNAVKFTQNGGIDVEAGVRDGRLRVAVRDTGCGIPADRLAHIFDSFEQVDAGTTRRYGGTGLGLAISRRLAQIMGGDLTVTSVEGEGSCFTLDLPAVAADQAAPDVTPATAEPLSLAGLSVLAVDDHAVNRRILALLLEPHGVRLTSVENGLLAVEACAVERFDVVLMDMQMPVMDGLEATRRLRQSGANADTPVVALTANALDTHRAAWAAIGVDRFLTKPIDPTLLAQTLADARAAHAVAA